MTIISTEMLGASSASSQWSSLPWKNIEKEVKRLQMRIAKAAQEGRTGKVKALQRLLTTSFYAKCLSVKRVSQNKGSKTPGVDGVLWQSFCQRMKAVDSLKRKGYRPLPLRRIYIPKKNPKAGKRPLSIPCLQDRAMQALWQLALAPVAEGMADLNAYGFRPKRSVADAIQQSHIVLSRSACAKWVFEGDIKACFDSVSHDWLLRNVPMDKEILRKFLKAGFMEKGVVNPVDQGTPQGGIISPTFTVIVMSGLERLLKKAFQGDKVNFVGYADDFIITGKSKELLEEKVIPLVEGFLKERGLVLHPEKSKITHVDSGFDFLGHSVRRYNRKLLTKPSKASCKAFMRTIRTLIKQSQHVSVEDLIRQLNLKIIGWATFYRHSSASRTFSTIDKAIYEALVRWMKRRHPTKSKTWRNKKYFRQAGKNNWQFSTMVRTKEGKTVLLDLATARSVAIRRYIKVRGVANPFDPAWKEYFEKREQPNATFRS